MSLHTSIVRFGSIKAGILCTLYWERVELMGLTSEETHLGLHLSFVWVQAPILIKLIHRHPTYNYLFKVPNEIEMGFFLTISQISREK